MNTLLQPAFPPPIAYQREATQQEKEFILNAFVKAYCPGNKEISQVVVEYDSRYGGQDFYNELRVICIQFLIDEGYILPTSDANTFDVTPLGLDYMRLQSL